MNKAYRLFLALGLALLLAACGGGDGSTGSATLSVAIKDLPSAAFTAVTLSIREVAVIASDEDSPITVFTLPVSVQVNVLDYRDHALQLGAGAIPPGSYQQVRLVLDENPADAPPLNYVMLNCTALPDEPSCDPEQLWALKSPSGQTSGLKIVIDGDLALEPGEVQVLTLDFDPSTALVERGDWDPARHESKERFLIKPTGIRTLLAETPASYGILGGSVAYSDAPESGPRAAVTAFDADTLAPVAATLVDPLDEEADSFRFFLAAGDYNLDVRAEGYQPLSDGPFSVDESDVEPHPETDAGLFELTPQIP